MHTMEDNGKNGNGTAQFLSSQDERIGRLEDRTTDLHATLKAHIETETIKLDILGHQITDLKDTVIGKIEQVGTDVTTLQTRTHEQADKLEILSTKEFARLRNRAKMKWVAITLGGGLLTEVGHQLIERWPAIVKVFLG